MTIIDKIKDKFKNTFIRIPDDACSCETCQLYKAVTRILESATCENCKHRGHTTCTHPKTPDIELNPYMIDSFGCIYFDSKEDK